MKYYARLENNIVVEVIKTDNDIKKLYHADFVAQLIECDNTVKQGFVYDNGKFKEPVIAKPDLITMQYNAIDARISHVIKTANIIGEPANYDSIGELVGYRDSNNENYRSEALILWGFVESCHKIQADIVSGVLAFDSVDDAIAALPTV